MSVFLTAILIWVVISIPIGIFVGRMIETEDGE
jgi:ABC-type proline/glycine betaine transport system permease subunit